MKLNRIPEEAVVDAALFDPLGTATVLSAFSDRAMPVRSGLLFDIARKENLPSQRMQRIITALRETGLVSTDGESFALAIEKEEALRHAAVLRGVAYAQYRQRDANRVEVTLSPPAHPSRLMEILPKQGFSWARLYDTKDSLIELASQARQRFTIVSPFLDLDGIEWIINLFQASDKRIQRTLIVRGRGEADLQLLRAHRLRFSECKARVLAYAISHDPDLRSPSLETFHAKILLADVHQAYIGSANMNRSSRDFSMECGVIIAGPCVRPVATLVDAIMSIASQLAD
jgi:phosphatidylserine/phosphatidylglycerophosphate/cardiolipin synthase-like enzyme